MLLFAFLIYGKNELSARAWRGARIGASIARFDHVVERRRAAIDWPAVVMPAIGASRHSHPGYFSSPTVCAWRGAARRPGGQGSAWADSRAAPARAPCRA